MYYRMHPEALWPLNFWSTTIHMVWVMYDLALYHSHAFNRQFTACRLSHQFVINTAQLAHLSSSSSFSSISMTYHRHFSQSQSCAPGLSGELCCWMRGLMQHDGHHSDRFVLSCDCSCYDLYIRKKQNQFPKIAPTHRSFSTFSSSNPSNIFAILHHPSEHSMMCSRHCYVSQTWWVFYVNWMHLFRVRPPDCKGFDNICIVPFVRRIFLTIQSLETSIIHKLAQLWKQKFRVKTHQICRYCCNDYFKHWIK